MKRRIKGEGSVCVVMMQAIMVHMSSSAVRSAARAVMAPVDVSDSSSTVRERPDAQVRSM
jgi:hypothetical protein